jgi:hypothetical protein
LRPSVLVAAAADEADEADAAAGEFPGASFIVPGGNSRPDRHAQVSEFPAAERAGIGADLERTALPNS